MKSLIKLTCLFVLTTLSTMGQDRSQDTNIVKPQETTGADITVSTELFAVLTEWVNPNLKNKTKLEEHLLSSKISKTEIEDFLHKYYSGKISYPATEAVTPCICKSISPGIESRLSRNDALQQSGVQSDHLWVSVLNREGPAHANFTYSYSPVDFNNGMYKSTETDVQFQLFSILLLCTEMGVQAESCNCNKQIYFQTDYNYRTELTGSRSTFWSGYESQVVMSMFTYSFESFNNNSLVNSTNFMAHAGHVIDYKLQENSQFNIGSAIAAIATITNIVTQINQDRAASFDANQLSNLINNIITTQTSSNSGIQTGNKTYIGNRVLKSNIPTYLVNLSKSSTVAGGNDLYIASSRAELQVSSCFFIPHNSYSYNNSNPNEPIPNSEGSCCNEAKGAWWLNPTEFAGKSTTEIKENIRTFINNFGYNNFSVSSNAIVVEPKIQEIIDNQGEASSNKYCHCDGLTMDNGILLFPDIFAERPIYCGSEFLVKFYTANWSTVNLLFSNGLIDVRWYKNNNQIFPVDPSNPNSVTCDGPGTYHVELVLLPDGECITSDFVIIQACEQYSNRREIPQNFKVIELNLNHDDQTITFVNNKRALSSANIYIYDLTGKLIMNSEINVNEKVNVNWIKSGMYIVSLYDRNKNLITTERIMLY